MTAFKREINFEAKDSIQAAGVLTAIQILLESIQDKKNLIELGKIIKSKPGLIEKAIPFLPTLRDL